MKLILQSGRVSEVRRRTERHGLSYTSEGKAHRNIVQRCTNPKNPDYPAYGARLKPCLERKWRYSLKEFIKHVGPRPGPGYSINRKDNSVGYVVGNVEWATARVQADNRSTTRIITYGGVRASVSDWGRALGMTPEDLRSMLRYRTLADVLARIKAMQDLHRLAQIPQSRAIVDVLLAA